MDDDYSPQLLAEQLKHLNTLYKSRIDALEERLSHAQKLADHRLASLESLSCDHESRIRAATEGVTQFKIFSGLASGGSSIMSLIALIKAFLSF